MKKELLSLLDQSILQRGLSNSCEFGDIRVRVFGTISKISVYPQRNAYLKQDLKYKKNTTLKIYEKRRNTLNQSRVNLAR
ncbi:hypothetical protein DsansV1_C31g0217061 [Dioscorea sansibarensis]